MSSSQKSTKKVTYDASSFQILEGLDAVRKRPGMYIGSTDSRGLQHCLWEIVDNAVDEALGGHCTEIEIILHADNSIEVRDNGRGIPVDIEPKSGLSGIRVVFEKLHAGGKFGGGAYSASGGLHGVGASVVNALSSRLDAKVYRDGKEYSLSFYHGEPGHYNENGEFKSSKDLKQKKSDEKNLRGTIVRFWPDKNIFIAGSEIDIEKTIQRARQTAFMVPTLSLKVTDKRSDLEIVENFKYDGGIVDFVDFLTNSAKLSEIHHIEGDGDYVEKIPVLEEGRMVLKEVKRTASVNIAFNWSNSYDITVRSFVNIIETPKGGTHLNGVEKAFTKVLNDYLKTNKINKSDDPLIKEDVFEGINLVVLVKIQEPQFEGQTKEILGTPAIQGIANDVVSEGLRKILNDPRRKNEVKVIVEKVYNSYVARKAAKLHRETMRRKNALESSSLPSKLADCRSEDLTRTELFIIEGDSAGGTLKLARDSEYQALLPIRGKILNTMKSTEKQMLDNAECAAIISAMGAGSGVNFDINNIRYGKLIITADADVDGSHIRCLLLTLCWRYMRPLLENGNVYAAMPPLYRIEVQGGREHHYCYTDQERDSVMSELKRENKKVKEIQRYKGLGEMDADQLAETTIDVSKRKLRKITMSDAQSAEEVFELCMGADVSNRKEFITEYGGLLSLDRIDT